MAASLTPLRALLMGAVVLAVGVLGVAVRRRDTRGARPLAGMMVGVILWSGGAFLASLHADVAGSVFWIKVDMMGAVVVVASLLAFALEYTGRGHLLTRRTVGLLAIHPLVVTVLVWTNPSHGLLWSGVAPDPGTVRGVERAFEAGYYGHVAYSYVLILASSALLLELLYRSGSQYRGQATALLVAILAPLLGNALFVTDTTPADLTPVAFAVSGLALAWSIRGFEFMDLAPVARSTVVEDVNLGVIVVDREGRVVDRNSAAEAVLGVGDGDVGRSVETALADYPQVRAALSAEDEAEHSRDVKLTVGGEPRTFTLRVSPLTDRRGRRLGRLLLAHDVTEQRRHRRELERQNRQLEQFASLVSHDLRNPLNVADAYRQQAGKTGDPEALREVERAHARMRELIDDVLELTRQSRTVTETETVAVAELAARAWRNVDTADAELRIDTDATVEADPTRLLRAFENLFRNSVEHGSTGSRSGSSGDSVEHGSTGSRLEADDAVEHAGPDVSVRVGTYEGGLYVADDGPGIPPERREQVLEDGFTTDEDGTGLGLSIVTSAVEAHGWSIRVTESDQGGARFDITGVEVDRPARAPGAAE